MVNKLRWYTIPNSNNGVNTLLIPETNDNRITTWKTVSDKDEVVRLLVERNTEKLCMFNKSPFATGPIADAIGPYGDTNILDKILDGTITRASLGLDPNDVDVELDALLMALQYTTTSTGEKIPQMDSVNTSFPKQVI